MAKRTHKNPEVQKVLDAVNALSNIKEGSKDSYEDLGVLVLEVFDMLDAKDAKNFLKQKKEARDACKAILKEINNTSFRTKDEGIGKGFGNR